MNDRRFSNLLSRAIFFVQKLHVFEMLLDDDVVVLSKVQHIEYCGLTEFHMHFLVVISL